MSVDAQAIVLPICTVQHDFQAVVKDISDVLVPEDKFWVSCYKQGDSSVHGHVTAALDDHDRNKMLFEGHDGVAFKEHGKVSSRDRFILLQLSMQTKFAFL